MVAHNPLRSDPTRTKALRQKFDRALRSGFRKFNASLFDLVVTKDVFGIGKQEDNFKKIFGITRNDYGVILPPGKAKEYVRNQVGGNDISGDRSNERTVHRVGENPIPLTFNVGQREWAFLTDENKLIEFEKWISAETGITIIPESARFWVDFIQEGYEKGAGRAYTDANRAAAAASSGTEAAAFAEGGKQAFLNVHLGAPETIQKTKLLASRVFTDLKGVTEAMSNQIRRDLVDGLVQGQNARTVARTMARNVGISRKRAEVIARTEVIRAHAEGQLDALERMGVTRIGVAVEWSTAGDERVCLRCEPMEGVVFKVSESHGLIPRHPNCRCAFTPANVGESKVGQVRTKSSIKARINKSLKAEGGKRRTLREAKLRSRWAGKSKSIAKKRPKSILD